MRTFIALAVTLCLAGFIFKQPWLVATGWILAAVILFTFLWQRQVRNSVIMERKASEQAFLGDMLQVELTVSNRGLLPVPWLSLKEYVPTELASTDKTSWLLSYRGKERAQLNYQLNCKVRGRYLLGPLEGVAGVVLEDGGGSDPKGNQLTWETRNRLTVFPQIMPLEQLGLPSRLPLGELRTRQPLLYDPSRLAGVRDYYPGDDPRHIDWRNSARLNILQVKQFERTRQMPLAIVLDLRLADYQYARRLDCEVSIVVAASLANRANQLRQPFGLYSNGFDPYFRPYLEVNAAVKEEAGPELPPREGDVYLGQILDKLAGLQPRFEGIPIEDLLARWTANLSWGATIAVIALEATPQLAGELSRLKKAGFCPVAIFTSQRDRYRSPSNILPAQLSALHIPSFEVVRPDDLAVVALNAAQFTL